VSSDGNGLGGGGERERERGESISHCTEKEKNIMIHSSTSIIQQVGLFMNSSSMIDICNNMTDVSKALI